jgi:hypothetical protein
LRKHRRDLSEEAKFSYQNSKSFIFKEEGQYPNHPIWNSNFLPNEKQENSLEWRREKTERKPEMIKCKASCCEYTVKSIAMRCPSVRAAWIVEHHGARLDIFVGICVSDSKFGIGPYKTAGQKFRYQNVAVCNEAGCRAVTRVRLALY